MGILSRFSTIMKSNVNAMLDKMEDPAKMIDQTLIDLKKDLAQVKQETAQVMANEASAQRQVDAAEKKVATIHTAAGNALKAGNEDDARALLAQEQEQQAVLNSLNENLAVAKENTIKIRQMYDKLSADIQSLENRKAAVKAKVATAKAQEHINKATANMSGTSASMEAFDRMEAKADRMLDEANANAQLNADAAADTDLVKKYTSGSNVSVDDDLAALKAELGL